MALDKRQFLELFIEDVLGEQSKTWAQYGEDLGIKPERLRSTWRYFKNNHLDKGIWAIGVPMSLDWQEKAKTAVYMRDGGSQEIPPNMQPEWVTQELKGGEYVVTKKTYKRDKSEEYVSYLDKTVEKYREIIEEADMIPHIIIKRKTNGKTLQLLTADKHVGAANFKSLFGNTYDADIFDKRMNKIISTIDEISQVHGRFDYIDIIDLGDGTDGYNGQTSRGGHALEQNLTSDEQFDVYVSGHKKLFDSLVQLEYANNYSFIVTTNDNHNGVSWMYPCARGVEIYLNAKYPEITTTLSKDFIFHFNRGKHTIMLTHGKDDKYMKSGLPLRLDQKTEKFINAYIDYNELSSGIPFNQEKFYLHLLKGDLHQSAEEFGARFRYKNTMSFFGASDYIEYNFTRGYSYKGFEWQILYHDRPKIIKGQELFFNK